MRPSIGVIEQRVITARPILTALRNKVFTDANLDEFVEYFSYKTPKRVAPLRLTYSQFVGKVLTDKDLYRISYSLAFNNSLFNKGKPANLGVYCKLATDCAARILRYKATADGGLAILLIISGDYAGNIIQVSVPRKQFFRLCKSIGYQRRGKYTMKYTTGLTDKYIKVERFINIYQTDQVILSVDKTVVAYNRRLMREAAIKKRPADVKKEDSNAAVVGVPGQPGDPTAAIADQSAISERDLVPTA